VYECVEKKKTTAVAVFFAVVAEVKKGRLYYTLWKKKKSMK